MKVAEECKLSLEGDMEEFLYLRKSRKKSNAARRNVKWLGAIFNYSLYFNMHWKSPIAKARKALAALSGVEALQWDIPWGMEEGV